MALWARSAVRRGGGVLFRSGEAIEKLAAVRTVLLDKTGTLTTGAAVVERFIVTDNEDSEPVLRQAARMAAASSHVYSQAIRRFAGTASTDGFPVCTQPGRGLCSTLPAGGDVYLGSLRLMEESHPSIAGACRTRCRSPLRLVNRSPVSAGEGWFAACSCSAKTSGPEPKRQ
jgi:cation transport ATPase